MGTLTIRISDDTERALRKRAAQLYGARRGALSRAIEEAIRAWLSSPDRDEGEGRWMYRAFRGDRMIAEASTLEELASILRQRGESVRGVRIVREPAPSRERRLGLRTRRVSP